MATVTVEVSVVTTLPAASSMATLGWVDQAVLEEPPPGCWVKASCEAEPAVMVKLAELTLSESVASVAVRLKLPALSILQPEKEATPAVVVAEQPERVPVPVWMDKVMAFEEDTVLPEASSMLTTGWVDQAVLEEPPPGWVVKTTWLAEPEVILKADES